MGFTERSGRKRGPKRIWPSGTTWVSVPLPHSVAAAIRERFIEEIKPGRAVLKLIMETCPELPWPGDSK